MFNKKLRQRINYPYISAFASLNVSLNNRQIKINEVGETAYCLCRTRLEKCFYPCIKST